MNNGFFSCEVNFCLNLWQLLYGFLYRTGTIGAPEPRDLQNMLSHRQFNPWTRP